MVDQEKEAPLLEAQKEGVKDETKPSAEGDPVKKVQKMPVWQHITGKLTFGSIAGYMLGNFLKQISDELIFYGGLQVCLFGGLAYIGWIKINFMKIDKDLFAIWQNAKKRVTEKSFTERFRRMLMRTIPLLGGFAAGFKFGFASG